MRTGPAVRAGVNLYPWDVVGDPGAADRIAALGVADVTLAAVYHGTRAATPAHPGRRIVTADRTAAYHPLDERRWSERLRPAAQTACPGQDPFGAAATALRSAGLGVTAWAVLLHVDGPVPGGPGPVVVNAYGDRYPWALCAARDEAREYAAGLAAAAATRPGVGALELESCGWYGFAHLHEHDKTAGLPLTGAAEFLLSLCFCPVCARGYALAGVDPVELRRRVVGVLDRLSAGTPLDPGDRPEWTVVGELLGAELAAAVLAARRRAGDELRSVVLAAVRTAAGPDLPVLLHADVLPHRSGAYTGLDPATALGIADGLVVSGWGGAGAGAAAVRAAAAAAGPASRVVASLLAVRGMGGDPAGLPALAAVMAAAGATELRFYHAGLATTADLAAITAAVAVAAATTPARTAPR